MIRLKKILVATDFRRIGDGARLRARADALTVRFGYTLYR